MSLQPNSNPLLVEQVDGVAVVKVGARGTCTMSEIQSGQWLEREDFGDMTVLRVKVLMLRDDETTETLFEQTYSLVEAAGRSRLVLNLDGVGFMASAAIGKLIRLMRKAASAGGKLALCSLSRSLEEVLRVSRLSDVLLSYADEQEALQALIAHGGSSS
jgi:anti-anti-sigma factor